MRPYFILCLLISASASSEVIFEEGKGSAFEVLMSGAGQARLGSHGSLTSNPALLSWLPKKQEVISTNLIRSIKFRNEDIKNAQFETDVIPMFAVTTRGFGRWGHSYGLSSDILKFTSKDDTLSKKMFVRSEEQDLKLHYGAGYKLTSSSSVGLSFSVGRNQRQSGVQSFEAEDDKALIFSSEAKKYFWTTGMILGYAGTIDNVSIGCSVNMMTSHFGARSEGQLIVYYRDPEFNISNLTSQKITEVGRYSGVPSFNCGTQFLTGVGKLYLDTSYISSYEEAEGEDITSYGANQSLTAGFESPINDEYTFYSGALYHLDQSTSGEMIPAYGGLSVGASKKNLYSMNYGGVRWGRPIQKPTSEFIELYFGTKFEY